LFREQLIKKYGGRCIVTGVDDKRILLASHIRPWAVSSNEQRLSSENGLLLSPLYDKLFDVGLITFSDEGNILCSKELENKNIDLLKIDKIRKYDLKISAKLLENLKYHQNTIFLGLA
jgi:predicted restriction endonuclease